MKIQSWKWAFSVVALGVALVGCGGGDSGGGDTKPSVQPDAGGLTPGPGPGGPTMGGTPTVGAAGATVDLKSVAKNLKIDEATLKVPAGMGAAVEDDPGSTKLRSYAMAKAFGHRHDPFALQPSEKMFEGSQRRDKLVGELSGFPVLFQEPEEKPDESEIIDPPPSNFRLSGVMQANGIVGLMTDGQGHSYTIRPGFQVPNTEWVVVSLDQDHAVLRRKSNKRPREWYVRLQGAGEGENLPTTGGNNNGGNPFGQGGRPGGAPAGPAASGASPGGGGGAAGKTGD